MAVSDLPPLEDVIKEYDPETVQQVLRGLYGNQANEQTPSEQAVATRNDNDSMRQLLMMGRMFGQGGGGASSLSGVSPLGQATGIRDLMQGGPYDPRSYAYGPTKAGPYVFWPTPPPKPDRAGINTSLLAAGLTNALNNYLSQRKKKPEEIPGG